MKIGIYQCEAGGKAPNKRIAELGDHIRRIREAEEAEGESAQKLQMLICPELFLTGYHVGAELLMLAEPITGPKNAKMSALAREYEIALVYGFVESDKGSVYNSAACVNAQGKIVAKHRKLMIPPGFERDYFKPGKELTSFELGGMRFGMLICYDMEFPEAVRATVKTGIDALIVPTALAEDWALVADNVAPTRAFENSIWVLYANQAGKEGDMSFAGRSCIVDPTGHDQARADQGEALIHADLTVESVKAAQEHLPYLNEVKVLMEILP